MQRIDNQRLGGMVGRRVASPSQRHGPVTSVVVYFVLLMQSFMVLGQGLVAQLRVDQCQVVVSRHVFRIELKCILKLLSGLPQQAFTISFPGRTEQLLGSHRTGSVPAR